MKQGLDPNAKTCGGYTPLHLAAQSGCVGGLTMLLNRKDVDVNALTKNGQSPLIVAAIAGQVSAIHMQLYYLQNAK